MKEVLSSCVSIGNPKKPLFFYPLDECPTSVTSFTSLILEETQVDTPRFVQKPRTSLMRIKLFFQPYTELDLDKVYEKLIMAESNHFEEVCDHSFNAPNLIFRGICEECCAGRSLAVLMCVPNSLPFHRKFIYWVSSDEEFLVLPSSGEWRVGNSLKIIHRNIRTTANIAAYSYDVQVLLDRANEFKMRFLAKFPDKVGPIIPTEDETFLSLLPLSVETYNSCLIPSLGDEKELLRLGGIHVVDELVFFGPNQSVIQRSDWLKINWTKMSSPIRTLLRTRYDRNYLATHSLSGTASNAFKEFKQAKAQMDPRVVKDVIAAITAVLKCQPSDVKRGITSFLADESKMLAVDLKRKRCIKEEENGDEMGI